MENQPTETNTEDQIAALELEIETLALRNEELALAKSYTRPTTLAQLFGAPHFINPAKPGRFDFEKGGSRTPLADVVFDLGGGVVLVGAQVVDMRSRTGQRTIELHLPNQGKANAYSPIFAPDTERDKAEMNAWLKATVLGPFRQWRAANHKAGNTARPQSIKADAVVFGDDVLTELGLMDETPKK